MILVYTGNGKGKTSASVGQAVRAHGQGLVVAFGQFMKEPGIAGEQRVLAQLLGSRFLAVGEGFFRQESERPRHRAAALRVLAWAQTQLEEVGMLVLDESLYALGSDLVHTEELQRLVDRAQEKGTHLVLSGRGAPAWLVERADFVTEMGEVKHPYTQGHKAQRGIEF